MDRDRWDDPGRLIEAYFAGRRYGDHDPDTVILAWLSILRAHIEPPIAARSLIDRLRGRAPEHLSDQQRRLLDLLAHVAAHRRPPSLPHVRSG